MTAVRSRMKGVAAIAGVATITAGSVLGTAGSASAASAQIKYTCSSQFGPVEVVSTADTNLPSTIGLGKTLTGVKLNAKVILPADLHALAYKNLGARSVLGTGSVNGTAGGVAKSVKVTLPKTAVTGVGTLVLPANGTFSVTGTKLGPQKVVAGSFSATMRFLRSNGTEALALTATCKPKTGVVQDLTIDKYTVVKAATAQAFRVVTG